MKKGKNTILNISPYEGIAKYYDELMDHVDYKQWAEYIKTIFSLHDKKIKSLVDMSCGTGSLLVPLSKSRIHLTGSDNSFRMLQLAKEKTKDSDIHFIAADFRKLPFLDKKFDAALVMYDSVNYLLKEKEVQLFLSEAYRILKKHGLLIFDVVTPYTCSKYFRNYHVQEFDENGDGYERKSWFDEKKSLQYNEFHINYDNETFFERHKQRIRSVEHWADLLKQSLFADFTVFGDFTFMPAKKKSERVHFICEKGK